MTTHEDEVSGRKKSAIAVDFDGVIHHYGRGWHDGTAYDDPVPGAMRSIKALLEHWNVFIHSTRDAAAIDEWLTEHNAPFKHRVIEEADIMERRWMVDGVVGITNQKLVARFFIDDRAIVFDKKRAGEWDRILEVLKIDRQRGP